MITYDELEKLAALAKLSLEGEDMETLARDITDVLDFANVIAQAALDLPENDAEQTEWYLREDILQPSLPVDAVLKNAGEQQDGYFVARHRGGLIS
jgi:aspartyl-tRNA(Asn)/glutamyl-tRNA(Gln) amidotransferase subunit C